MIFLPLNSRIIHDLPTSCPAPLQIVKGRNKAIKKQSSGPKLGVKAHTDSGSTRGHVKYVSVQYSLSHSSPVTLNILNSNSFTT